MYPEQKRCLIIVLRNVCCRLWQRCYTRKFHASCGRTRAGALHFPHDDPRKISSLAIEPEAEEDEEATLPEAEESIELADAQSLAGGRDAIARFAKLAPSTPGVYRMIGRRRRRALCRQGEEPEEARHRLCAADRARRPHRPHDRGDRDDGVRLDRTETEALLLEANLIKRLRPRFNVLLRDDKSFPYILLTGDHASPQICKHRGARSRKGDYFGPFASAWAVNRTINALQRAFLLRSCTDAVFESRTRPCLLYQIKRCSAPCTGEISHADYAELVGEARAFLSGTSQAVKEQLAAEMEQASERARFRARRRLRDRLAALSAMQSQQGINLRGVDEADVFAVHQEGGFTCIEVFFFRAGQNWGNRAYFPKADRSLERGRGAGRVPGAVLRRQAVPALHPAVARGRGAGTAGRGAGDQERPQGRDLRAAARREARTLIDHALANAREALGRKLAETASQQRLLAGARRDLRPAEAAAAHRGLRQLPHQGHQRGRRHDRRRAGRVSQEPVPQVQHPLRGPHAGRRFRHDARGDGRAASRG